MKCKRVWIYCRTAYPNAVSLAVQEQYMIDYAKAHGFLIAGVTSEHGSGLNFSPQCIFESCLQMDCSASHHCSRLPEQSPVRKSWLWSHAIEMGEADALLVKELSRLGRDVEETDVYLHWLKKHNVTLICADGTVPQTALHFDDSLRHANPVAVSLNPHSSSK